MTHNHTTQELPPLDHDTLVRRAVSVALAVWSGGETTSNREVKDRCFSSATRPYMDQVVDLAVSKGWIEAEYFQNVNGAPGRRFRSTALSRAFFGANEQAFD